MMHRTMDHRTQEKAPMTQSETPLWRVERAFRDLVGPRATELMHRPTKHLADLSPFEVAHTPAGARIVLTELPRIAAAAIKDR